MATLPAGAGLCRFDHDAEYALCITCLIRLRRPCRMSSALAAVLPLPKDSPWARHRPPIPLARLAEPARRRHHVVDLDDPVLAGQLGPWSVAPVPGGEAEPAGDVCDVVDLDGAVAVGRRRRVRRPAGGPAGVLGVGRQELLRQIRPAVAVVVAVVVAGVADAVPVRVRLVGVEVERTVVVDVDTAVTVAVGADGDAVAGAGRVLRGYGQGRAHEGRVPGIPALRAGVDHHRNVGGEGAAAVGDGEGEGRAVDGVQEQVRLYRMAARGVPLDAPVEGQGPAEHGPPAGLLRGVRSLVHDAGAEELRAAVAGGLVHLRKYAPHYAVHGHGAARADVPAGGKGYRRF